MVKLSIQSDIFEFNSTRDSILQLPEFPSVVRYYGDFEKNYKTLLKPRDNLWELHCNGGIVKIDYDYLTYRFVK